MIYFSVVAEDVMLFIKKIFVITQRVKSIMCIPMNQSSNFLTHKNSQ